MNSIITSIQSLNENHPSPFCNHSEEGSFVSQYGLFIIAGAVLTTAIYLCFQTVSNLMYRVQQTRYQNTLKLFDYDMFSVRLALLNPRTVTKDSFISLVNEGLCLNSEKFLEISDQRYAQRHTLLSSLLENLQLPETARFQCKELLGWNERKEQRYLLQYLSAQEKSLLSIGQSSPINESIIHLITSGGWTELFENFGHDSQTFPYTLLAAYCTKQIDIEDLATGMTFYRTWMNAGEGNCRIVPIKDHLSSCINLTDAQKAYIFEKCQNVKENQTYLILIKYDTLDQWTKQIFKNTFVNHEGDFLGYIQTGEKGTPEEVGTFSFGASKTLYPRITPTIHLTPSVDEMFYHVKKQRSDYALFFPGEESCIHGSNDNLIFAQIHDLFHTYARAKRAFIQEEMMSRAQKIQVNPENRKQYESKLNSREREYPAFIQEPTEEELLHFLLDRIKGEVVDGGYTFTKICSFDPFEIDAHLNHKLLEIAKSVIQYEYGKQPTYLSSFPQQTISNKIQAYLRNNCI